MPMHRRQLNALLAGLPTLGAALPAVLLGLTPGAAQAQAGARARQGAAVLAMVLEPTSLDPTTGASAAIGEIVHYNVLEGLTKIAMDGAVVPLLCDSWQASGDDKTYSFSLKKGVKFSDGSAFDANVVKFNIDRARAPESTNKARKAVWDNVTGVQVQDPHTVIISLEVGDTLLPFRLGENTAVMLHPGSAAQAATRPVGTGPFTLESWNKGTSITLLKSPSHRDAAQVKLQRATFRFISDPAAQVAALLAGDVDAMPRFGAPQAVKQFERDRRFTVTQGFTAGKGILAINNRKKPFDDVRVRRALAHAIDRKAVIDGALDGLARPIGSHFAPTDLGYQDLTKVTPYDPDKARALLREAGVATANAPLNVVLTLPPPQYARKGGEIIAAQLAKVGVNAKIENVEWAQWLSGAFKGNFDLTVILHVEPLDYIRAYTDPNYYFGYDSAKFRGLVATLGTTSDQKEKFRVWRDIQRQLADDAVNVFLFNPSQVAVVRKGLRGVWTSSPIFANDLAAMSWAPAGTA